MASDEASQSLRAPATSEYAERRSYGDVVSAGRRSASPFTRNAFSARLGNKRLTAYSTAMESIEAKAEPVEIEPMDSGKVTLWVLTSYFSIFILFFALISSPDRVN